ncbi:MAG: BrnA antitoxin family protein [bacterium]
MSERSKRAKRSRRPSKAVPRFKTEDEEREFWATHDSSDFVDWAEAKPVVLPHLKPSTETISLRLPESLLNELKVLANQRDVPYQSLLKIFLAERLDAERRRKAS